VRRKTTRADRGRLPFAVCRLPAFALLLLLAGSAAAQSQEEPQYFEEPKEKPHFTFQWDFLARYDNISHLQYYEDISRGRFELRPQVGFTTSPEFQIGVRGVFNYGTEKNIDNALYQDNYVSRGAYVDRYFVEWTPDAWTLQAGAFALPVAASEMLWDKYDIQTPGAAASWVDRLGPTSTLTFTAAGIYSAQRYRDESILGVGQVLWKSGEESRFAVQASGSFWNMDMRNVDPQYYRENRVVVQDGRLAYQSKYQLVDLLVKLQFPVARLPVTVSLDYIHNFGAPGRIANAYEAGVAVGTVGTPKTWRAFFVYQYIGRDALVGAYNTDDWWWHTWAEGYRFGVSYTILPMIYVQPAVVFQRRLDYDFWINRVSVDLVKLF
jgi:hypothetical protein